MRLKLFQSGKVCKMFKSSYYCRLFDALEEEVGMLSSSGNNFLKNRNTDDAESDLLKRPDKLYREMCESVFLSKAETNADIYYIVTNVDKSDEAFSWVG